MEAAQFFDTLREALRVTLWISLPMLSVALLAGVGVGLFQALTSIQEMTLTFVPKVALMLAVYWVSMSFMADLLLDFFQGWILPMIGES